MSRRRFWNLIYDLAAHETTVLVTTHYMDEAEHCDQLAMMLDGRIVAAGTPVELRQRYAAGSLNDAFVQLARGE